MNTNKRKQPVCFACVRIWKITNSCAYYPHWVVKLQHRRAKFVPEQIYTSYINFLKNVQSQQLPPDGTICRILCEFKRLNQLRLTEYLQCNTWQIRNHEAKTRLRTSRKRNITERMFLVCGRRCSFVGMRWMISSTSFRSCFKKEKKCSS